MFLENSKTLFYFFFKNADRSSNQPVLIGLIGLSTYIVCMLEQYQSGSASRRNSFSAGSMGTIKLDNFDTLWFMAFN